MTASFRGRRLPPALPILLLTLLAAIVLVSIFADALAPFPPDQPSLRARLRPPAWLAGGNPANLLGTDALGRDILSRILYGGRTSLAVGCIAVLFAGTIGIAIGLVAGYAGGLVDAVLMRISDAANAIPIILIALLFVVTLGASFMNVTIALVSLLWARYTRVIRSEVLSIRSREYIVAARLVDASHLWIIRHHLLPNVMSTVIVLATLQVGSAILIEAALSFLGAGVPPPTPAWGSMAAEGRNYVATAWWITFFPGMAILVTVFIFNLLGDWLRDLLDPRLRQL